MYKKIPLSFVAKFMNIWPPYLGAGVRIKLVDKEKFIFNISMPLRFYNRNYVGVHFGGSLYSMCDPFYMLILMNKLGRDYIVWDKAAEIKFKGPGRSRVHAQFEISDETVNEIKDRVEQDGKFEPLFSVELRDEADQIVAIINKRLWVRKK